VFPLEYMRAIFCFDCFAGTASAKLFIKSLISHDIAARQWRDSNPSPYFACEIKIRQKMSTKVRSAGSVGLSALWGHPKLPLARPGITLLGFDLKRYDQSAGIDPRYCVSL
jgi:hypothetical protein